MPRKMAPHGRLGRAGLHAPILSRGRRRYCTPWLTRLGLGYEEEIDFLFNFVEYKLLHLTWRPLES